MRTLQLVADHDNKLALGTIWVHDDILDDMANGVKYEIQADSDMANNTIRISMRKVPDPVESELAPDNKQKEECTHQGQLIPCGHHSSIRSFL